MQTLKVLNLNYFTTSRIHLSLEDYHNAGLTPEETKAEIEKIRDPASSGFLYCEQSGINRNWTVRTMATNKDLISDIVFQIEIKLFELLEQKLKKV